MPEHQAAGVAHGVSQRHRPQVLDRQHQRRAAVGQLVEQARGDDLGAGRRVRVDRSAELGAGLGTLRAGETQADQSADRGAQLGPLVVVQIRDAQHRRVVAVAHHERRVDDPDLPDVTETCQLVGDPTLEQIAVREADHECLDGSDAHGEVPPARPVPPIDDTVPIVSKLAPARITQI